MARWFRPHFRSSRSVSSFCSYPQCQQYIPPEAKTSDDAQEQVWMHAHGPWREKLEQAVYNLIKDLWKSFPEADILFRKTTTTTPRCADAIWAALLTEYPLDASHLKYKLLSEEMSRVVKPPITHTKFFKYKADQVDAATHLKRFSFSLDETFAAVQLSSYHSSGNVVLKTAYDKVMTKLETDPKLPLSTTLINQVTDKCFKRAASLSSAADLDDPDVQNDTVLVANDDSTNKPCPGCRQCPIHCIRDGLWRPKPSKFDTIKSPRPGQKARAARALVANLDDDTIKNLAVLSLQGKPVDLDATLEQVQDPGPPSPIDHRQTVSALLAQAAQWSDVSGDSDIHEDDL